MEIWYNERSRFTVSVTGPNDEQFGPVEIDNDLSGQLPDGTRVFVDHTFLRC